MKIVGGWDQAGAIGAASFGIFGVFNAYRETAPKLADLRDAALSDYRPRQLLLDADVLVGALALGTGAIVSIMSGSLAPVLLMSATMVLLSGYYRFVVLNGATPTDVIDAYEGTSA